jgi:DNA-binding MarR family transcriptional regulator
MPTEPQADGAPLPLATMTRWLTDEEQRGWRAYIQLAQLLMRQLDRDLHPFGLSTHDYEILVELSEAAGRRLRMTDLADRTAQSRSRLSHQISRMEARGLVVREGCEGDKRGTFAVLTGLGAEVIGQVAPHHVASVRRHFIDQLAPGRLGALAETCEPVLDTLRMHRERD